MDTVGNRTPRDPEGEAQRYAELLDSDVDRSEQEFAALTPHSQNAWTSSLLYSLPAHVVEQYAGGEPLDAVRAAVLARSSALIEAKAFLMERAESPQRDVFPLDGNERECIGFAGLALLLVPDSAYLATFRQMIYPSGEKRGYLFDLLVKGFVPDYVMAKKYKANKYAAPWIDPLVRALAEPPERRAAALAAHMKNWCRIMRPWGCKPDTVRSDTDPLFPDFAFEVALAVCAYDIDDSSFNAHPYYPRDLVEYYRANVRATRDAWRAYQAGAGVPVIAPPPPAKADLAKTKRKGVARWVELVCDGNIDACVAVLETVGKPRKIKEIDELMCALAEEQQAIHADIKDDDSVVGFAQLLAQARALGEFDMPPGPPFGPARASAALLAFSQWLAQRGYRLVDLDGQDDAWHAVLVKAEYQQELLDLGATLGLVARDPLAAYGS